MELSLCGACGWATRERREGEKKEEGEHQAAPRHRRQFMEAPEKIEDLGLYTAEQLAGGVLMAT